MLIFLFYTVTVYSLLLHTVTVAESFYLTVSLAGRGTNRRGQCPGTKHPPRSFPLCGRFQRNSLRCPTWCIWETKTSPWLGWCVQHNSPDISLTLKSPPSRLKRNDQGPLHPQAYWRQQSLLRDVIRSACSRPPALVVRTASTSTSGFPRVNKVAFFVFQYINVLITDTVDVLFF